jgi:hypothetical protein
MINFICGVVIYFVSIYGGTEMLLNICNVQCKLEESD